MQEGGHTRAAEPGLARTGVVSADGLVTVAAEDLGNGRHSASSATSLSRRQR